LRQETLSGALFGFSGLEIGVLGGFRDLVGGLVGEFQERLEGKHHAQVNAIPSGQELNRRVPDGAYQSDNTV
jgi:hypothetical protein